MKQEIFNLLNSGEIPNINLALQIISSGIVEWGTDIEQSIYKATRPHLVNIDIRIIHGRRLSEDVARFTINDNVKFHNTSVEMSFFRGRNVPPILFYSFVGFQGVTHKWFRKIYYNQSYNLFSSISKEGFDMLSKMIQDYETRNL